MKRLLVALTFLLCTGIIAAAGVYSWGKARFESPGPLPERTTVVIPEGAGVADIARRLHEARVIARPWLFVAGTRVSGQARRLKAGEFAFPARVSPQGALNIIVSGETVARKLTIPEGVTSAEAVAILADAAGLKGRIDTVPPEGTLLPETYHYRWGERRTAVLARMQAAMDRALDELWPQRADDLPFDTRQEAVILASIVEKETAVPKERALVAGVFVNRLHRGMRLQSDPTVRYAVRLADGQPLDRPLTRADLRREHPYNTYRTGGLPPGPIANPGRASIAAVLDPAETDYLYFVADGSGGHAFARTLAEHNRNVARWRALQRNGD